MIKTTLARTKLGLDFTFLAVVAMFLTLDTTGFAVMSLIACLIHEAGHLTVMLFKGNIPTSVIFRGGGIRIGTDDPCIAESPSVLLGGSVVNIAIFFAIYLCLPQPHTSIYPIMFATMNLVIGLFNLLPIGCLDGNRLLKLFLPEKLVRGISGVVWTVAAIALTTAVWRGDVNFTLIAAMIYVILVDVSNKVWYNNVHEN